MTTPEFRLIAEVFLYSVGFIQVTNARSIFPLKLHVSRPRVYPVKLCKPTSCALNNCHHWIIMTMAWELSEQFLMLPPSLRWQLKRMMRIRLSSKLFLMLIFRSFLLPTPNCFRWKKNTICNVYEQYFPYPKPRPLCSGTAITIILGHYQGFISWYPAAGSSGPNSSCYSCQGIVTTKKYILCSMSSCVT